MVYVVDIFVVAVTLPHVGGSVYFYVLVQPHTPPPPPHLHGWLPVPVYGSFFPVRYHGYVLPLYHHHHGFPPVCPHPATHTYTHVLHGSVIHVYLIYGCIPSPHVRFTHGSSPLLPGSHTTTTTTTTFTTTFFPRSWFHSSLRFTSWLTFTTPHTPRSCHHTHHTTHFTLPPRTFYVAVYAVYHRWFTPPLLRFTSSSPRFPVPVVTTTTVPGSWIYVTYRFPAHGSTFRIHTYTLPVPHTPHIHTTGWFTFYVPRLHTPRSIFPFYPHPSGSIPRTHYRTHRGSPPHTCTPTRFALHSPHTYTVVGYLVQLIGYTVDTFYVHTGFHPLHHAPHTHTRFTVVTTHTLPPHRLGSPHHVLPCLPHHTRIAVLTFSLRFTTTPGGHTTGSCTHHHTVVIG